MFHRVAQRHERAERVTGQRWTLETELVDDVGEIGRVVGDPVGAVGGPAAFPVAAKVQREDVNPRAEVRYHEIPPARVRRSAVQQHEGRARPP